MHLSSHNRHRPAPAALAAASSIGPDWLPIVAAAAQLVPSACTAWLVLYQRGFAATVAATLCSAVCCAVTVVAVARWYRRAMTVAVHSAVRKATQDPLTGLPTRAALEHALDRADAADAMFTVALADVDGLHDINTRWGHAAGDQYLAAIARTGTSWSTRFAHISTSRCRAR